MKRLLSLVMVMIFMFSASAACAQVPEILTKPMYNYTEEMSVSFSFESCDEIIALLEEMEMPEEISWYVDLKALLNSLFAYNGNVYASVDMSEDYKKIKMSLESDSRQYIEINKNFNADINTKMGMWIEMDFTSLENPVLKVIYSAPMLNKYMIIDVFAMTDFETKAQIIEMMSNILSKENIDAMNTYSIGLITKYAKTENLSNSSIITYNNEGLVSMLDEMYGYMNEQMKDYMPQPEIDMPEEMIQPQYELPSFEGVTLLGDKGIVCKYNYAGGKINSYEMSADISLNIKELYTALSQQEWIYENEGQVNFSVKCVAKIKNTGKTKVSFPELNEENSVDLAEKIQEQQQMYPNYTEMMQYPYAWVDCQADELPVVGGDIYVPLRTTLENAYFETVNISYENGIITATSEYFPEFKTISVVIGGNALYTDLQEYNIGEVIKKDGITYVNYHMFEDVFGWALSGASYDMLEGNYWYSYTTFE